MAVKDVEGNVVHAADIVRLALAGRHVNGVVQEIKVVKGTGRMRVAFQYEVEFDPKGGPTEGMLRVGQPGNYEIRKPTRSDLFSKATKKVAAKRSA